MKHIGKVFAYLILAVNAFFVGILLLTAYSPHISPVIHPVEACMGLTFPIFLSINFCFLIFWLIVRYKFALLSILGFAIRKSGPIFLSIFIQQIFRREALKYYPTILCPLATWKRKTAKIRYSNISVRAMPTSSAYRNTTSLRLPKYILMPKK